MADDNNNILLFSGEHQHLTLTLKNPYSSKEIILDDEYNVNNQVYDGLGGRDVLSMTSGGDYLSLTNSIGLQVIKNIEVIQARDGGDVINLAHKDIVYGDVEVGGSVGDDIIWTNSGNDSIHAGSGNDIVDGGPGNDHIIGAGGNDQLFGGAGNDYLSGGPGDDILYGGTTLGLSEYDKSFIDSISFPELKSSVNIQSLLPPGTPSLGINADNLTVETDATATLTFIKGFAGYNNSLGIYSIAEDGTIQTASLLWGNVKDAGYMQTHTIDLPLGSDGGQFGFFIIADGDRKNAGYNGLDIEGEGNIKFIYDYGGANERAATINDNGKFVSVVYDDGATEMKLSGYHYHTTPRGDTPSINWDGKTHAVSGLADPDNPEILRIGFEDLPNLGDSDYEDVLFDLDINRVHIDASEVGHDTLIGGYGNDYLYGEGGDDLLSIGFGLDNAWGGSGADIFFLDHTEAYVFSYGTEHVLYPDYAVDFIHDFNAAEGDTINISDLLYYYDPLTEAISDFVNVVHNGENTEIQADFNGGGDSFQTITIVLGGIEGNLQELLDSGQFSTDTMPI